MEGHNTKVRLLLRRVVTVAYPAAWCHCCDMLTCIAIMGNMFVSDGTAMVALEHVVAARLRDEVLEIGMGTGGAVRFNVSGYPPEHTITDIVADCANDADVAGILAAVLSSPAGE